MIAESSESISRIYYWFVIVTMTNQWQIPLDGRASSYSAILRMSSGDTLELPLTGDFGRVMLRISGGGRVSGVVLPPLGPCGGLVENSAPCGLYASSVQIRSGRQIARRTGMTGVQQAVQRRNIPGAII